MLAPVASQMADSALMKLMRCASIAFTASFESSEGQSPKPQSASHTTLLSGICEEPKVRGPVRKELGITEDVEECVRLAVGLKDGTHRFGSPAWHDQLLDDDLQRRV